MSSKQQISWLAVLPSLVIPLCLGLTMYLGWAFLIERSILTNELLVRYTTGHPISRLTMAMFFVGSASLLMIGKNVFDQFLTENKIELSPGEADTGEQRTVADTRPMVPATASQHAGERSPSVSVMAAVCHANLQQLPDSTRTHYLWRRLSAITAHLQRSDSTTSVEEELKYLSEMDADRQQQRYSLVRILIWATPMLGFLGTVLGISEALGGIAIGPENNFENMMNGLRGSLYVAFDTTALALTLSMLMMFGLFLIDRFELQLLTMVDNRTHGEVTRYFDLAVPESSSLQRFSDEFLAASRQAVFDQTKVWAKTIHAAEQAWASTLTETNDHVQMNLTDALAENFDRLSQQLASTIDRADNAMSHRWQQWQVTLSDNCRLLADHQQQLVDQTKQAGTILDGCVDGQRIESAIAQNQQAIAATKALQESMVGLADSIQQLQQGVVDREQPPIPVIETDDVSGAAAATPVNKTAWPHGLKLYQEPQHWSVPASSTDSVEPAQPAMAIDQRQPAETEIHFFKQTASSLPVDQRATEPNTASVVLPAIQVRPASQPDVAPEPVAGRSDVAFKDKPSGTLSVIESVRLANQRAAAVLANRRAAS